MRQIDLHEAPTGAKGAGGTVGNEDETIGRKRHGGREGGASDWGEWKRRVIAGWDRDGGSSRDRGNGTRKRQRSGGSCGVGIWDVSKLERRRVISWKRRRKPHIVTHLDMEWVAKRVDQRGMRVIEMPEIWSVDGCAREQSRRKRGQSLSWAFEKRSSGLAVTTDHA